MSIHVGSAPKPQPVSYIDLWADSMKPKMLGSPGSWLAGNWKPFGAGKGQGPRAALHRAILALWRAAFLSRLAGLSTRCTVVSTRRDDDALTWLEDVSVHCEEVSTCWEETSRNLGSCFMEGVREGPSRWRRVVSTCREDVSTRWDDVSSRWYDVSTRRVDVSLWRVLSTRGTEDLPLRGEAILPVQPGQEGQRGLRLRLCITSYRER